MWSLSHKKFEKNGIHTFYLMNDWYTITNLTLDCVVLWVDYFKQGIDRCLCLFNRVVTDISQFWKDSTKIKYGNVSLTTNDEPRV